MSKNLNSLREELLYELGDSAESPSIYTNEELLNKWIFDSENEASKIRPRFLVTSIPIAQNIYRYDAPVKCLGIDRITYKYGVANEFENDIAFEYEPYGNLINITGWNMTSPLPTGGNIYIYYRALHTNSTESVENSFDSTHDSAIVLLASSKGAKWIARKLASNNQGVFEFTRGAYSEKTTPQSIQTLFDIANQAKYDAVDILGGNDPVLLFASGIQQREYVPIDKTMAYSSEFGFTGEYMGNNRIASVGKNIR